MSAYADLCKGTADEQASRDAAVAKLRKEFPLVAEILAGIPKTRDSDAIPPGTVTFYLDSGKCCAIVKPKDGDYLGFLAVDEIENPWQCVNDAINGGSVAWKKRDKRTPSF